MFQSTPAIADGRTSRENMARQRGKLFQSTPAIADGRTVTEIEIGSGATRFNPRPPSLTGEPRVAGKDRSAREFQSTPAIADGRTQAGARW